jgi:5-methyltetrahydrofolate--homocysteine methyltransferase
MKERVVILDGAMGTALQAAGMGIADRPEIFGAARPDIVQEIHQRYINAGSDLITANTFGVSGFALDLFSGAADNTPAVKKNADIQVEKIVSAALAAAEAAVSISQGNSGQNIYVALDIGPSGQLLNMSRYNDDIAYRIFSEQIKAGRDRADCILFETFYDIKELQIGLRAAMDFGDGLPVFCSLTYMERGRTFMGASPEDAVRTAEEGGASAVGVNCSLGPDGILPIVKQMLDVAGIPVFAQPNAGLPDMRDGKACYDMTPDDFADTLVQAADIGASALGGCCGTDERFVYALKMRLDSRK